MKTIENSVFEGAKGSKESLDFFKDKTEKLEDENQQLHQTIEELEAKVKFYEEQIKLNAARNFGSKSEKIVDGELSLFNEVEKESVKSFIEADIEEITFNRKKGRSKSRKTYEDLEVEEVIYDLLDEEKDCPKCGNELHHIKYEVRKELKYIPATVKVVHHKKEVCGCRVCELKGTEGTIITAKMPNPVLPKSMVSPSLLAIIMDMKYQKMVPLYRQEQSFIDYGIDLSRQNMASWVIKGADTWLKPLFLRMRDYMLEETIIHADETVLNVLDEKDNKNNYMWLYATGDRAKHRIYLYDYQKSRSQKNPKNFLKGFDGYLQTDGYAAYGTLKSVTNLGCLAHARRKFTDVIKAAPKDSEILNIKSSEALSFFSSIYKFEKKFRELPSDERYKMRLKHTKPLLDNFKEWLDVESKRTLPKSKLGEAIRYSLKQWDKLIAFLEDGRLSCDNNLAERGIKPFVMGRKNFLFSKSALGATASGIVYSIIETAKANGLKPMNYLTYLFEKLPNIDLDNYDQLDAYLPWSEDLPKEIYRPKTESSDE